LKSSAKKKICASGSKEKLQQITRTGEQKETWFSMKKEVLGKRPYFQGRPE